MTIRERGRACRERWRRLAPRTAWDWRRCPSCGGTQTPRWGGYTRHPGTLAGRQTLRIQRPRCRVCQGSYAEDHPLLVRGSGDAREVHRAALDHWQPSGRRLRRTAEWLRSCIGKQDRWLHRRPQEEGAVGRGAGSPERAPGTPLGGRRGPRGAGARVGAAGRRADQRPVRRRWRVGAADRWGATGGAAIDRQRDGGGLAAGGGGV